MVDPVLIRPFVLAGNAVITLQSKRTDHHYTYRIRSSKNPEDQDGRFVSVLAGPEEYRYLGMLRSAGQAYHFTRTKKTGPLHTTPSYLGFAYFWRFIETLHLPPDMIIRHEGRCGRCGRPLTHPNSIDRGLGDECAAQMDR
jgi:hypothetical protein